MNLLIATLMFTPGRIIFAVCFAIIFIVFMVFSYRKDAKNHKRYYKNTAIYVAIALFATLAILVGSKYLL